jgi:RNA polymerase sigma-70 factor (ECF subfamily)
VVAALTVLQKTDEELLAEASREGSDGPAFVELLDRYRDRIWRLCYRLMGNETDASDAAQEVFVRLFLNRTRFEGRSAFSTWLYGMGVRTCLGLRRSRSRRSRRESVMTDFAFDQQATPGSQQGAAGASLDLFQMLETLPEEDRAMLLLKHAEGYSYEELAEVFQLSVSACKMRVSRAKERLNAQFGEK